MASPALEKSLQIGPPSPADEELAIVPVEEPSLGPDLQFHQDTLLGVDAILAPDFSTTVDTPLCPDSMTKAQVHEYFDLDAAFTPDGWVSPLQLNATIEPSSSGFQDKPLLLHTYTDMDLSETVEFSPSWDMSLTFEASPGVDSLVTLSTSSALLASSSSISPSASLPHTPGAGPFKITAPSDIKPDIQTGSRIEQSKNRERSKRSTDLTDSNLSVKSPVEALIHNPEEWYGDSAGGLDLTLRPPPTNSYGNPSELGGYADTNLELRNFATTTFCDS
jgi:hypothetical protein